MARPALVPLAQLIASMEAAELERFWAKVDRTANCWMWTAATSFGGYGTLTLKRRNNIKAHRLSYILHNGPIPPGLLVCHSCDNPSCVNPAHLWLGTQKENIADMWRKGRAVVTGGVRERARTYCPSGHAYDKENTRWHNNKRTCITCAKERKYLAYYQKQGRSVPAVRYASAAERERSKTHCPSGHEYSGDNLRVLENGWRQCRTCDRLRVAERRKQNGATSVATVSTVNS